MKKIASVAAIALFTIGFISCKKDYTCECNTTTNGTATGTPTTTKLKDTKKNAKSTCEKGNSSATAGGTTIAIECKLK